MIKCTGCKIEKPFTEFSKHNKRKNGLQSQCKSCVAKHAAAWYLKNIKKVSEDNKTWRANNPKKAQEIDLKARLKNKYGISVEEYNAKLLKQNNICAICNTKFSKTAKACVDHCHTSLKVREILCKPCNSLLGFAKDNIQTLENAIQYLKHHS